MAEDITQGILRNIQGDLALFKAGQNRVEDMVRGLPSIMAGIAGRLEGIEDRLGRIERESTP